MARNVPRLPPPDDYYRPNWTPGRDPAQLPVPAEPIKVEGTWTSKRGNEPGKFGKAWEAANDAADKAEKIYALFDAARGIHNEWRADQTRLSSEQRRFGEGLLRSAARSGDLSQLERIEHELSNIPGATRREGIAAYSAISQQAPDAPLGDRLALATQAATLAPLGHPAQTGRLVGTFASLGGDTSNNDLLDLAVAAREELGAKANRLTRRLSVETLGTLTKQGYSTEASLALLTSTIREGRSAYNLNRAAMGGADIERLQKIAGTDRAGFEADLDYYHDAQGQDLAAKRLEQIGQSRVGRQQLGRRLTAVATERSMQEERSQAMRYDVSDEMLEAQLASENAGWLRRSATKVIAGGARLAVDAGQNLGLPTPSDATVIDWSYRLAHPVGSLATDLGGINQRGRELREQINDSERPDEIVRAIKEQTAVLRNMGARPTASAAYVE